MSVPIETVRIELAERSYPILIGSDLIQNAELLGQHITARDLLIVTNETIAPLHLEPLLKSLGGKRAATLRLPDGESHKTLATYGVILDALMDARLNRDAAVIALGGGVIGDMAGFAAASYQRGIDYIQIPTTLLAQVDSSVGGKTAVNHPKGKNMIGAFYQPRCVIADTSTLSTLPDREYKAGIAEVVKYGLIYDPGFFEWLEANADALNARAGHAVTHAIKRSCEIKAEIVGVDEREHGLRAILNLGHTFGHAIETAMGYGTWLHGEAVAAGMIMAADMSVRLEWLRSSDRDRAINLLERFGLPVRAPAIGAARGLELMGMDKKVLDRKLRLVLLRSLGRAEIVSDYPRDALDATLQRHFG
jgi:3-dehydroquinate synthase